MSHLKNQLGTGAAIVAMAFGAVAPAFADGPGLINDDGAVIKYRPALSIALRKATGDDLAGARAGGFMVSLEEKLKAPMNRPQMVTYPQEFMQGMLVIGGVVPPVAKMATTNIPFCADQSGRVVYKGYITPKGDVVKDDAPALSPIAASTDRACRAWLLVEGKKMMQTDPAQPPPTKAENPTSPRTEAAK